MIVLCAMRVGTMETEREDQMRKNDDKTFIDELQVHYEIGISIYNDLKECNPDIAYLVKEFKNQ